LLGIIALAVLCTVQWQRDRKLNLEVNRLEKIRIGQEQTIAEQARAIQGSTRDLNIFKDQFADTRSNLLDARKTLEATELENTRLMDERNQLKASVTNWMHAVAVRGERLADMEKQARSLAEKVNQSVRKYNELATNYNSVVEQLNAARKQNGADAGAKPPP
jgi:hypothetical protein